MAHMAYVCFIQGLFSHRPGCLFLSQNLATLVMPEPTDVGGTAHSVQGHSVTAITPDVGERDRPSHNHSHLWREREGHWTQAEHFHFHVKIKGNNLRVILQMSDILNPVFLYQRCSNFFNVKDPQNVFYHWPHLKILSCKLYILKRALW